MNKERQINLTKMFWYVVKKWRFIIVCMLLLAIAMGAKQYKTDFANAVANQNVVSPSLLEIKNSLSQQEMTEIEIMQQYKLLAESTEQYMTNSVLMQIPYDKEQCVTLQYYIDEKEKDDQARAANVQAYYSYVANGSLGAELASQYSQTLSEQYVAELISAVSTESAVTIKIVHYDKDEAEKLAELVKNAMVEYASVLNSEGREHDLCLQSQTESVIADYELYRLQSEKANVYDTASGAYLGWKEKMNANQQTVIDNWDEIQRLDEQGENVTEKVSDEKKDDVQPISVSINVRTVMIGAIAGLFLAILLLLVSYIGTKKVRDENDYLVLDVELLGTTLEYAIQHRLFGVIDKCIGKIQYKQESNISEEEKIQIICSSIYLHCINKNITKLYFTGTGINELSIVDRIIEELKDRKIEAYKGGNILYRADALVRAAEMETVVLVEKEWNSKFSTIANEVDTCSKNGISILGGILIRA